MQFRITSPIDWQLAKRAASIIAWWRPSGDKAQLAASKLAVFFFFAFLALTQSATSKESHNAWIPSTREQEKERKKKKKLVKAPSASRRRRSACADDIGTDNRCKRRSGEPYLDLVCHKAKRWYLLRYELRSQSVDDRGNRLQTCVHCAFRLAIKVDSYENYRRVPLLLFLQGIFLKSRIPNRPALR